MRRLTSNERTFLQLLVDKSGAKVVTDFSTVDVISLEDGMGSIGFCRNEAPSSTFYSRPCDCYFSDLDGTRVEIVFLIDELSQAFELDVWKVDFSRVLSFPQKSEDIYLYGPCADVILDAGYETRRKRLTEDDSTD